MAVATLTVSPEGWLPCWEQVADLLAVASRKLMRSQSSGSVGFGKGIPITTTHLNSMLVHLESCPG